MASAYLVAPHLGILVALAIALHNLPEQFAMSVPAVSTRRKRITLGIALAGAFAEPLGAAIRLLIGESGAAPNAELMALAAGAMLFVSLHELIPLARQYDRPRYLFAGIVIGLAAYWLLVRVIPE